MISRKWQQVLDRARLQQRPVRLIIDAAGEASCLPFGLLHDSSGTNPQSIFRRELPAIRFVRILRQCLTLVAAVLFITLQPGKSPAGIVGETVAPMIAAGLTRLRT